LQIIVSIFQRNKNRDLTGDPWNGRTLEWSTTSPAPFYNFAILPTVSTRDPFWEQKHNKDAAPRKTTYQDIELPKNSSAGIFIGAFSFVFGFAIIWHIWWLAVLGLLAVITSLIIRLSNDDFEYTLPASEVKRLETAKGKA
jgi:cytochrome o ubiquinol oxidase subunit 1